MAMPPVTGPMSFNYQNRLFNEVETSNAIITGTSALFLINSSMFFVDGPRTLK